MTVPTTIAGSIATQLHAMLDAFPTENLDQVEHETLRKLWFACHRIQCAIDTDFLRRNGIGPAPASPPPRPVGRPDLKIVRKG